MRIFEGVGDAHPSSHLGTSAFSRLRARIRGGTTPRLTVVVAVLACVVGSGLWRVAPSEARARNGLIAYSQETDQCDNDNGCGSYVRTVGPRGRGRRKMPCSTGPRQGCADVLPVFSPRGRRLATAANEINFIEDEKGRLLFEDLLAVRDVSGRVRRTISQLEKGITAVAWSADARQLGFSTLRGIYTVRPDGTDQKLFSDERAGDLAWSRQGRLAWTPMNGGRIRVTNRARIRVRRLRVFAYSVAWSPSGRRLAYITTDETLKTVSANGRNRRTLTTRCDGPQSGFGFDSDVAWSPDGRQLLCSSLQRGLLAVNVRTGRVRTVVRGNFSAITSFDWQKAPRR